MSTAGHRSRLRRPFDSINANTLSTATATSKKGDVVSNPVKKEKRRGLLSGKGLLSSILTPKNRKKERPQSSDPSSLESPTKKLCIKDGSEPAKPKAAEAVLPKAHVSNLKSDNDNPAVFRQLSPDDASLSKFWDDEMEELLELKMANPILDESRDDKETLDRESESCELRTPPEDSRESVADNNRKDALTNELDENASGDPLSWTDCLSEEDNDGIKIPYKV